MRFLYLVIRFGRIDVRIDRFEEFLKLNWFGKDDTLNTACVSESLGFPGDRGQEDHRDVSE